MINEISIFGTFKENDNVYVYNVSDIITKIIEDILENRKINIMTLSKEISIKNRSIYYWKSGKRPINLKNLIYLIKQTNKNEYFLKTINKKKLIIGFGSQKNLCTIPNKISGELAYLVGYLMGDGCLTKKWTIRICDEIDTQINYIEKILKSNFDLKGRKYSSEREVVYLIYSKCLWLFLHNIFDFPKGEKKGKLRIPNAIKNGNKIIKIEFIRGFLDADGGLPRIEEYKKIPNWILNKSQIEISQSTQIFLEDLKNLLLEFNLKSNGPYYHNANKCYRLILSKNSLSSCNNIKIFRNPYKSNRLTSICKLNASMAQTGRASAW